MQMNGKWCVVVGAAAGIGQATARALLHKGARLVLADVDRGAVDDFARRLIAEGGDVLSYGVDVSSASQMLAFYDFVQEETGGVDVLVNSAGILRLGGYEETPLVDFRQVFEVNFWGIVHACRLFVPGMVERRRGVVVNVASAAGIVGFAPLTAYSASKFAVVGFSDALRAEVGGSGVQVSTICPGLVRTTIAERTPLSEDERSRIAKLLERRGISAEIVAEKLVRAVERGTPVVHVGLDAKAIAVLKRALPDRAARLLGAYSKRTDRDPEAGA